MKNSRPNHGIGFFRSSRKETTKKRKRKRRKKRNTLPSLPHSHSPRLPFTFSLTQIDKELESGEYFLNERQKLKAKKEEKEQKQKEKSEERQKQRMKSFQPPKEKKEKNEGPLGAAPAPSDLSTSEITESVKKSLKKRKADADAKKSSKAAQDFILPVKKQKKSE